MQKILNKVKDKLADEIDIISKKTSISPAEMEHLRKAVDIIANIRRIECCDFDGYSESKHMYNGYSGHSVRDRIIDKLEKMIDDDTSNYEKKTIRGIIEIVNRMSY